MMMIQPITPMPRKASFPFSPGCASNSARNKIAPFPLQSSRECEAGLHDSQGRWF